MAFTPADTPLAPPPDSPLVLVGGFHGDMAWIVTWLEGQGLGKPARALAVSLGPTGTLVPECDMVWQVPPEPTQTP